MNEKIEKFDDVMYYLQSKEILFTLNRDVITYFALVEEKIRVKSENYNYYIQIEELKELFKEEVFYLYEKEKEENELEAKLKDDEYYSWHHK